MTFSTNETSKQENYFLSQPHQPFFLLGIINAIIMMLIFALNYKGVLNLQVESFNLHVYSLIFLVFTNVFTGFLFTTFPRFCQSEAIDKSYYTKVFYANLLGSVLFLLGSFVEFKILMLAMFVLFSSQLFIVLKLRHIYNNAMTSAKGDQKWIMVAQYFGIFSHLLFLFSLFWSEIQGIAIGFSFYMYLIFLTFSIAQRMIPFFAHSFAQKDPRLVSTVFVLLFLKTVLGIFESYTYVKVAEIVVDILLALYLLNEFLRWELPLFKSQSILWVLFLGLFWLPTALLFSALSLSLELLYDTSFYFLGVHLLSIGFLTTILIGFGTRVTLGHSGQAPNADKLATSIFWFVQAVVIIRALYSINIAFGWGLNFLFDISFTLWLILFLVWSLRYGKVLVFGSKIS